jgi:hypothetical protein
LCGLGATESSQPWLRRSITGLGLTFEVDSAQLAAAGLVHQIEQAMAGGQGDVVDRLVSGIVGPGVGELPTRLVRVGRERLHSA